MDYLNNQQKNGEIFTKSRRTVSQLLKYKNFVKCLSIQSDKQKALKEPNLQMYPRQRLKFKKSDSQNDFTFKIRLNNLTIWKSCASTQRKQKKINKQAQTKINTQPIKSKLISSDCQFRITGEKQFQKHMKLFRQINNQMYKNQRKQPLKHHICKMIHEKRPYSLDFPKNIQNKAYKGVKQNKNPLKTNQNVNKNTLHPYRCFDYCQKNFKKKLLQNKEKYILFINKDLQKKTN